MKYIINETKSVISEKKHNIGSMCLYFSKRLYMLDDPRFLNFKDIAIVEKCWYIDNNIDKQLKCICSDNRKWRSYKEGYNKTCGKKECIIDNRKSTNIEIYGYDNPMKNESVKIKNKSTIKTLYGCDNVAKSDTIRKKITEAKLKHSDEKRNDINRKKKNTWDKKTLDEKASIIDKRNNTWNKKTEQEKKNISDRRLDTIRNKYNDISINSIFDVLYVQKKIKNSLQTRYENFGRSKDEIELYNYIKNIYSGLVVINTKSVIYPFELDIYIPDIGLAIEFNGDYWHSDRFKTKDYHLNKTIICEENNIELIHIFGSEWKNNSSKIKDSIYKRIYNQDYDINISNYINISDIGVSSKVLSNLIEYLKQIKDTKYSIKLDRKNGYVLKNDGIEIIYEEPIPINNTSPLIYNCGYIIINL